MAERIEKLSEDELDLLMEQVRRELREAEQPPSRDPHKDEGSRQTVLAEVLALQGVEFLREAYRTTLDRSPDSEGLEHYLEALRAGRLRKIEVLGRLRYSAEGRRKGAKLPGLRLRYLAALPLRIPFLGYLLKLVGGVALLPRTLRNIRVLESHVDAVSQGLRGDVRRLHEELYVHHDALSHLRNRAEDLNKQISQVDGKITLHVQRFEERGSETAKGLQALREHVDAIRDTALSTAKGAADIRRDMNYLLKNTSAESMVASSQANDLASTRVPRPDLDSFYQSFEDAFRGTEDDIRNRLHVYENPLGEAGLLAAGVRALDIGCGRGEWLEFLKKHECEPVGVDLSERMVLHCREKGLEAVHSDAVTYLRGAKDGEFNVISSFHVVEHLPFEVLIELLDEALRVLAPGGRLILETPNPENLIVGANSFYMDPTHRNPIPPQLLQFVVRSRGFVNVEILGLHDRTHDVERFGIKGFPEEFQKLFLGYQDYAILASR
ncbi:MAG TPA: methyltransferase domain-containing protein [Gammaproteobacteria bacterium]